MRGRILIGALGAVLGCTACGFKGPLYLPGRSSAVVTPAAPAEKASPGGPQTPAKTQHKKTPSTSAQAGPSAG